MKKNLLVSCLLAGSLVVSWLLLTKHNPMVAEAVAQAGQAITIRYAVSPLDLPLIEEWYPQRFYVDEKAYQKELEEKGNAATLPTVPGSFNPRSFHLDPDVFDQLLAELDAVQMDRDAISENKARIVAYINDVGSGVMEAEGTTNSGGDVLLNITQQYGGTEQYWCSDQEGNPVTDVDAEVLEGRMKLRFNIPEDRNGIFDGLTPCVVVYQDDTSTYVVQPAFLPL